VAILDTSKTLAPWKIGNADLESWKSLIKGRSLDNGATLRTSEPSGVNFKNKLNLPDLIQEN
jgi:hypothetical protein